MNVTLDLPDEVANRLIALPQGERNQFAAMALTEAWSAANETRLAEESAIERGIADYEAGRTMTLDELQARMREHKTAVNRS